MLMHANSSCLMVVDIQEKLLPLVMKPDVLVQNTHWLMQLARELDVSLMVTEQYTKGLGPTVSTLRTLSVETEILEKVHFSVAGDKNCLLHLNELNAKQCIVVGMETSVCILQTALQLKEEGYDVFVVADTVSARLAYDHKMALKRMRDEGVRLVTKEMVFFEWIRQAGTARFKALSKTFLQG